MRRFARIALAAACLAGIVVPASPAGQADVATRLAKALAVPHAGVTAALAVDLGNGDVLFHRRAQLGLVPASNEKLAVTYTALAVLGPSYRIDTTVYGEGELIDGVWHGDLVLKGFGDPTLTRGDLRRLVAQLRDGGVRRVTGRVLGDESFFDAMRVGPLWKSSFYISESPPLSALTVDRASYRGFVSAEPALAGASAFRDLLLRAGIRVAGPAGTGRADGAAFPLGTVRSVPMSVLVRWMNRESDNFMAELLLKQLGAVENQQGTTARGTAVVRRTLAAVGVPLAGVRLVDGSGLSPSRPPDRRRARRHPRGGLEGSRHPQAVRGQPAGRGDHGDALRPAAHPAGARTRDREDRHHQHRLDARGLRALALRVRGYEQRPAREHGLGAARPGPLRGGSSRRVAPLARPR